MDFGPHAAEEVYQIHGTSESFSSKPDALDGKAAAALCKIEKKGFGGLEVHANVFGKDPQRLPKGFFLSSDSSSWVGLHSRLWKSHGSVIGYGIGHHASGYRGFKRSYVYHKDHHKTNWIMVVYDLISDSAKIMSTDVKLCHVFQSDDYDPLPKTNHPEYLFDDYDPRPKTNHAEYLFGRNIATSDFREEVNSYMLQLECLMMDPGSFNDDYVLDELYKLNRVQAKRHNGKRANVWERFTEIEVLGPDGEVMLTLAICHGCNMAYKTGKWDPKKRKFTNNGTNALVLHKCSGQHQISGDPQGAHH